MPLRKCRGVSDQKCISANIKKLREEGKQQGQAVAIALSVARKGINVKIKRRRKKR